MRNQITGMITWGILLIPILLALMLVSIPSTFIWMVLRLISFLLKKLIFLFENWIMRLFNFIAEDYTFIVTGPGTELISSFDKEE